MPTIVIRRLVLFALLAPPVATVSVAAAKPTSKAKPAAIGYRAPFATPAAELLKAPLGKTAGLDRVVLYWNEVHTFAPDGSETRRIWQIERVLTKAGVDRYSSVGVRWEPWYSSKPTIKARVIGNDGAVHWLNSGTIAETAAHNNDNGTYSNARVLQAPLPDLRPGSVIETEILVRGLRPSFAAGWVDNMYASFYRSPCLREDVTVVAPRSTKLRYKLELLPNMKVRRQVTAKAVILHFSNGRIQGDREVPSYRSPHIAHWPLIGISTGRSWHSIASRYGAVVQRQIADSAPVLSPIVEAAQASIAAHPDRYALIASLVAQLHQRVRYTGVEFNQAGLVPRSPAVTLQRGYGDCKDKATLLVALLRQAGVPASIALLRAGFGEDIAPELPGMGVFNHAIVYIPAAAGSPPMWVDATARYAPAGQLPAMDQGRTALIVAPGIDALTTIPLSSAKENLLIEKRDFRLAEFGPGAVVETSLAWGSVGRSYRSAYGDPGKGTRKSLLNYMKSVYLASDLQRFDHAPATDLADPYKLVLSSSKAKRGSADESSAAVAIFPWAITNRLPRLARNKPGADAKRRTEDFWLPTAFRTEWHYTITPPVGFRPLPLPEAQTRRFGPTVYTRSFRVDSKGRIKGLLTFDTGGRHLWSAAELLQVQEGLQKLSDEDAIQIQFQQIGMAALQSGKVRRAIQQFRHLEALHPAEALHHLQMARAMLSAGAGEQAREEAKRATQLQPNSAHVWAEAAHIFEHDDLGRKFGASFDRAAALNAFRHALKLKPKNNTYRGDYAILLEFGPHGTRYSPQSNLDEAIRQYEMIGAHLPDLGLRANLAVALARAQHWNKLRVYAAKLPLSAASLGWLLCADAALKGSGPAIGEHKNQMPAAQWRQALSSASRLLTMTRHYAEASALLNAEAEDSDDATQLLSRANLIGSVQPQQFDPKPAATPEAAARQMLLASFSENPADIKLVMSRFAKPNPGDDPYDIERTRLQVRSTGLPASVIADIAVSNLRMQTTSLSPDVVLVHLAGLGFKTSAIFVHEDGAWKALSGAYGDDPQYESELGAEAAFLLNQGNASGARALIDTYVSAVGTSSDPAGGSVVARLWNGHPRRREILLASSLMQTGRHTDLKPWIKREKHSRGARKIAFELELVQLYWNHGQFSDALRVSRQIARRYPDSQHIFDVECDAEVQLGHPGGCVSLAKQRLQQHPGDLVTLHQLVEAEVFAHQPVDRDVQVMLNQPNAGGMYWNDAAWLALFGASDLQTGLKRSEHAILLKPKSPPILHTLAALEAEAGDVHNARIVLLQAMKYWGIDEPNAQCWYVLGRIAEDLGLPEVAREDYSKYNKPAILSPDDTYNLVQRRLAALATAAANGKKPAAPKSKAA